MSAIFGFIDPQEKISNPAGVMNHSKTLLCRKPWQEATTTILPPISIGCVHIQPDSRFVETDQHILVYAGVMINSNGSQNPRSSGNITAQYLLNLYLEGSIHKFETLNGLFVIAVWNKDKKKLEVINNHIGNQKFYYALQNQCFYFSSEYKTISSVNQFQKTVNMQAFSDWLCVGSPLEEKALFKDIYALPTGTILTYQNGAVNLSNYWEPSYHELGDPQLSEESYVDGFAEIFKQSVLNRTKENTNLLLTGGLDSRSIIGFIHRYAPDMHIATTTLGAPNSMEVRVAKKIAQTFHYPHANVPIGLDYIQKFMQSCVIKGEGHMEVYESWILAENDYLENRQPANVLLGLFGNTLNGRLWPSFENINNHDFVLKNLLTTSAPLPYLKTLVKPHHQDLLNETLDTIKRLYHQAPSEIAVRKNDYIKIRQLFHRATTSTDILGDHSDYYEPFMDKNLVDFCNHIPAELNHHGYIFKKVIQKYIPEVTKLEYILPYFPLQYALMLDQHNLWSPIYTNYRKVLRRLKYPHQDNPYSPVYPNKAMRTESRNFILDTINQTETYADFLEPKAVQAMVDDHFHYKNTYFISISTILTFIHWLKTYT